MSYILDALKKSDRQRPQEHVPDLNTVPIEPPQKEKKKTSWPFLLAGILLLNVIVILFVIMRQEQPVTEPQAVVLDSDEHQSAAVREKQADVDPQSPQVLAPIPQKPSFEDLVAILEESKVTSLEESDKVQSRELSAAAPVVHERDTEKTENRSTGGTDIVREQEEAHSEPLPEPVAEDTRKEAAMENVPEPTDSIDPRKDLVTLSEPESAETITLPEEQSEKPERNQSQQLRLASPAAPTATAQKIVVPEKPLTINQLPASIRQELPEIHIGAHVYYKNKPASRLASINGKLMREGNTLAPDLKVAEISPDGVIFSYRKYFFKVSVF